MADGLTLPRESLRKRCERRVASMKDRRSPLDPLYRDLSDNFAPMRYRGGDWSPSKRWAQHKSIYNPTPKLAMRTLASGLHAGLSSPSRPWFRLLTPDRDMVEFGPVKRWVGGVEQSLRRTFAKSNLYQMLPSMYQEWGLFGTTAGLLFESDRSVIRLEPMTAGTYWIAENREGLVDTLYRERSMTARQLWQEFDHDRLPRNVLDALRSGRLDAPFTVCHLVTPADGLRAGDQFGSLYWINGGDKPDELLAERSFDSDPILTARWDAVPGDVYGSECPGIMALPAARELQNIEVRIANADERNSDPPLQAPQHLNKTGIFNRPGDVNYVLDTDKGGIRSIYDQKFDTQGVRESRSFREREIKETCYYDLFLMLTQDERNQRATAEEIRALYDEKVTGLAPVIEQGNPMLAKIIERTFQVMVKRSLPHWRGVMDGEPLLPPPPEELKDVDLEVEFISPLQQAQRAGDLGNIERFATFAMNLAGAKPDAADKVDTDQIIDEYASALYVPAGAVRSDEEVETIRADRAQQQQMQQAAAMAPALKQGADAVKTLAETQGSADSVMGGLAAALGGGGA